MAIHYPPAQLGSNSDQPTAITNVLLATSGSPSRTGDIPLNTATLLGPHPPRPLYPNGEEVIALWPGGALAGPPSKAAGGLDRLGDGQDDLGRAAGRSGSS